MYFAISRENFMLMQTCEKEIFFSLSIDWGRFEKLRKLNRLKSQPNTCNAWIDIGAVHFLIPCNWFITFCLFDWTMTIKRFKSKCTGFLASHIHHVSTTSNQFQESVNFDDASFSCNFSSFYTIIISCTCTSSLFSPRTVFVSVARFPNPNFVTNRTDFVE